ncbi:hypothetical protein PCASD_01992 [Puccinia coronata f. sp. avenae]|uniref:Uncharacterized protein n=1 Tax=Puccinia coronata f. sp. avenae TaxID=200324 RepID=A0A2N5VHK3_9BASI|nr:hypothetical protein PCASD_01992 [Puccinia coronata f. sp. avenae]
MVGVKMVLGQVLAQLQSNQNQPTSPSGSDAVASPEEKSDPPAISWKASINEELANLHQSLSGQ